MTGYAYSESCLNDVTVSAEIKGYNSRFLDLTVFLPPWLTALEPEIRNYMASRFSRGKIDLNIRLKEHNGNIAVTVNTAAAKAYFNAIEDLASGLGIPEKPGLNQILGLEGVLETERDRDNEKYRVIIKPVLETAADQFEAERSREGRHTKEAVLSHISLLEESVKTVESHVPELEKTLKENLRARFAEVLEGSIDENRVLAETAVLLMKYTISEELSRLASHLKEFRLETERAEQARPSGKKLDFLCQEINREINTIGSKTPVLEVSRAVVEMKNALEDIREQLRNVE